MVEKSGIVFVGNKVIFKPNVVLSQRLNEDDQERLFEKYGERHVVSFINKFTSSSVIIPPLLFLLNNAIKLVMKQHIAQLSLHSK